MLHYTERSLQNHQFKGRQVFPGLGDLESNWVTSWAKTTQDEPDLRFFTFDSLSAPITPRATAPLPSDVKV